MKIVSKYPFVWPHLGFSLKVGENVIDETDIPLAAHAKLEHLSKRGTEVRQDPEGKAVTVDVPGPISGYEPSQAFLAAAEKHNPKKAAARLPKVATLKTVSQDPVTAAPADKAVVDKAHAEASRLVETGDNKRK